MSAQPSGHTPEPILVAQRSTVAFAIADRARALHLSGPLGLTQAHVFTILGAPPSKSRPRFTRTGRTYTDPDDRIAEHRTGIYLRSVVRQPYAGNVAMACLFFRPNRQRIDVDNLLKHVCDSGNGVLWADDSQCTALLGVLELDAETPRTVIAIGEHVSTLIRGTR